MIKIIVITIVLTIIGSFCYVKFNQPTINLETTTIWINNQPFKALIADTISKRIKGLSNRGSLPKDEAMLFVFDKCDYHGFWMKDMNFPIDIIWLNEEKVIVDIKTNIEPKTWPKIFYPNQLAYYGIEINAGLVQKYEIKEGQKVMVLKMSQPDK